MSSAEPQFDARVRACLLWDVPWLEAADDGARQWLRALRLELVNLGELAESDILSIAANLVRAVMQGDETSAASLRLLLREQDAAGRLLEGLIGLWLELYAPNGTGTALDEVTKIVQSVTDADLQARMLLRVAAFALLHAHKPRATAALTKAVEITSVDTRLGVVARRWAVSEGVDVPGFDPYVTSHTPDDPLLTLPWVRAAALDAAAARSAEQLESRLRGVWDTSFHIGRTKVDDLLAAHAQAEWCGALDLRGALRKLLSSQLLMDEDARPDQVRWALTAWATSPNIKAVQAAITAHENSLEATDAANLLDEARLQALGEPRPFVDVALGVWDLVDDGRAADLISDLAGLNINPPYPAVSRVFANLLWRAPETWGDVFLRVDEPTKSTMLSALDPRHVDAMPSAARAAVLDTLSDDEANSSFGLALQLDRDAVEPPLPNLSPATAADLLVWRADAVRPPQIEALVGQLEKTIRSALDGAHGGSWGIGDVGTRLLADLATRLPNPRPATAQTLLSVLTDSAAAAEWQFGALEGLTILRHAGRLGPDEIATVRRLNLEPGQALFGERLSATLLRASQLRVYADNLDDDDIGWLAVQSRGADTQTRLVAVTALGEIGRAGTPTVDWSIVSGLFDPADEVASRAVFALQQQGVSGDARVVAHRRLEDLYNAGSRAIRRTVVSAAQNSPELGLTAIVDRAKSDRAWSVRREAT
jgi:hypothetical protein